VLSAARAAFAERGFEATTLAAIAARVEVSAAALAYLGSLHSYVMLHRVVRICEPPFPFDRYLKTLLEVWTRGAFPPTARGPRRSKPAQRSKEAPSS